MSEGTRTPANGDQDVSSSHYENRITQLEQRSAMVNTPQDFEMISMRMNDRMGLGLR